VLDGTQPQSVPKSLVTTGLGNGHVLRGSACFAKRQASMRDDVNMSLLCIVDAMLVICCMRDFQHIVIVWEKEWSAAYVCIFTPRNDVFLQQV